MNIKNIDKCSDEMSESASALPNIAPMARVANFNTGDVFSKAKQRQLKRELSRSKKRGDKSGAHIIEHKLRHEEAQNRYIVTQKQREAIKPVSPEENQVVIQGRVTLNGLGVDCYLVSLVNEKGSLLQKSTTNKSGGFTLIDDSGAAYAIKVSNKEGKVLYQNTKLGLSQDNPKLYLEIELSSIEQECDIKDPPQEDPKKKVSVPDLIGSEQSAAQKLLATRKLRFEVVGTVATTKHIDQIAKQVPAAKSKVEPRSAIKVWIGEKRKDIKTVDDFVGKSIDSTGKIIDGNELYSLDKVDFDKSGESGKVMAQIPVPGEPLKKGTNIRLKIGIGDDKKDLSTAIFILERDKEFQNLNITKSKLSKVLKDRKIDSLTDLRKLSRTSMKSLTATFDLGGIEEARVLKALLVDVTNQMKG
ncbi:MAG TPA: PASTA domain-containing protein [Kangiella sp.]